MYKHGNRDAHCGKDVQNQFDCSASRVLARGRRPDKVSGRILPLSRSHKGFSCIIFAGARRGIASSDGGSARIKEEKRGSGGGGGGGWTVNAKNDGGSRGAEERNRASMVSRRQNKSHELYWLEPMKNEERDRPSPPFRRAESNRTELSRAMPRRSTSKLELRGRPMGG